MIDIKKINVNQEPYTLFKEKYNHALENKQKNIEAVCISSYNKVNDSVDARMVNLKYINDTEWIFFSNYNSKKAKQFIENSSISGLFFWNEVNIQIRLKANIFITDQKFSDFHFKGRNDHKNALAISSQQSEEIESFEEVKSNFDKALKNEDLSERHSYWGGFSFKPYYFEFWEGHSHRLNLRTSFQFSEKGWEKKILQP